MINSATFLRFAALLTLVRWYNISLIVLAQLLAAFFVMNNIHDWQTVLLDLNLHLVVFASALTIASGFIINSFYDTEKDLVNRPNQTIFEYKLTRNYGLMLALTCNVIALLIGASISWRAFGFFLVYAFGLWFYSHKLKKITFVGNVSAALLAILPFFAVFFYYGLHRWDVLIYVIFLLAVEMSREVLKDLEGVKGDAIYGYKTIPATIGVDMGKGIVLGLSLAALIPAIGLFVFSENLVRYIPLALFPALIAADMALIKKPGTSGQVTAHRMYKAIIIIGILSIPLFQF